MMNPHTPIVTVWHILAYLTATWVLTSYCLSQASDDAVGLAPAYTGGTPRALLRGGGGAITRHTRVPPRRVLGTRRSVSGIAR